MLLSACGEPFRVLGGANPRAPTRPRAVQLFAALGMRVATPSRDAKYEYARVDIANAAMIPSRVWNDTAVWVSSTPTSRRLLIGGRSTPSGYRMATDTAVPNPAHPGELRHQIKLARLSDNAYVWDTEVQYGIGIASAAEVAAFTRALFASAEGRDEAAIRADYRAAAPRTAAVFAQVFTLDSIRTTQNADGSTLALFAVTLRPEQVQQRLPDWANHLKKYFVTARMHWQLVDTAGVLYMELAARQGRLTLRVRSQRGRLVSLAGPARPMPDTLQVNGELVLRVRGFNVGIRDYHPVVTIVRNDREAAWNIVSRIEPDWVLPIGAERLLRAPLRRPFQGSGASWQIGMRDSSGQTVLLRRLHLAVQESAILRFVGRMGAVAMGDYRGLAERDQNKWLSELFAAIVADLADYRDP